MAVPFISSILGAISAGSTHYLPLAAGHPGSSSAESLRQVKYRSPGVISRLTISVPTNATTTGSSVRARKNGVDVNGLISIGAGLTGAFQDLVNTDSVAAGDIMTAAILAGATGSLTCGSLGGIFAATTNDVTRYSRYRDGSFIGGTADWPICGAPPFTTEAQTKLPIAGTWKNGAIQVAFNNNGSPSSVTLRVNGVDSALAISVPASTTGWIEATGVDVATVANDLVAWRYVPGGGNIEATQVLVDLETTDGSSCLIANGESTSQNPSNTTRYAAVAGDLFPQWSTTTEAAAQCAMPDAGIWDGMTVASRITTGGAAATATLRVNGVDTALVVSIGAGLAGWFSTAGSVPYASADLVCVKLETGPTSTRFYQSIAMGWTEAPSNTPPVADAGPDDSCGLAGTALAGSGSDADLDALTYLWTMQSGPGTANFVDATNPLTAVSFTALGTYVLRLTVDDGLATHFDEMTMEVENQPPVVYAGPDQTITLPVTFTTLAGVVSDDGLI